MSTVATLRKSFGLAVMAAAVGIVAGSAQAKTFDGITIIEFKGTGGSQLLASGDHIVTFVSARGSYAAVASSIRGGGRGCISAAVPGSYTGRSIAFGVEGDLPQRRYQLDTLCPPFTLNFEGSGSVRVEAGATYSQRHPVVARIPFYAIDFGAAHFQRHDIRGVRLGPVLNGEELGPLRKAGGVQDKHKSFRRQVGTQGRHRASVQGSAAPADITGWPWDVLYYASHLRKFDEKVTAAAFRDAVFQKHGAPSSEHPQFGYMVWLYDLDGQLVTPAEDKPNDCLRTAEFWLRYDAARNVTNVGWNPNSNDFGAWGCSVILEINPNRSDGGVSSYSIKLWSGYAMAINHFFQRIEEPAAVMSKIQEQQSFSPRH